MKLKQLLILIAVLVAVIIGVTVKNKDHSDAISDDVGKNIFPDLKTEEISTIVLNAGKEEVILEIKDGKWTVKGRDGFLANVDNISKLVTKAGTMKAADVKEGVADKYLSRFKLQKPGTGGKEDETGTQVTFKKADGTTTASFLIGKTTGSSAGMGGYSNSQGQYVLSENAKDKVYGIKEAFDYFMNTITNKDWLDKTTFFKVENPKSVTVTTEKPEDSWSIFREKPGTDVTELKLADPKGGEEFDTSKASTVSGIWSSASFNDVATAEDKAKAGLDKPDRTVVIDTFDGFKYTIKIGGQVQKEADPNAGASEEYYVSVDVDGTFPDKMAEIAPIPDDKRTDEEKKKAKEDAEKKFADDLAKNKEKLAKEKALGGKVYVIAKFNVDPLLKNRAEFMKDKAAAPAPTAADGSAPPMAPPIAAPAPPKREPITATTPPISVDIKPEAKPEVKPDGTTEAPKPEIKAPETPAPAEPAK